MKRFLMLVGVAAVAAAMYVAASPASQQSKFATEKQFLALQKKVTSQGKTIKQLKQLAVLEEWISRADRVKLAVPIDQFGDGSTAHDRGLQLLAGRRGQLPHDGARCDRPGAGHRGSVHHGR
jgi:hypothetical protein